MISGLARRPGALGALGVLAALGLACLPAHAATGDVFTQLMALLGARQQGAARFVARTYAPGLRRPLVSSGELRYHAPDHLEQRTLEPTPSELILDGEQLTVQRGAHTRRLNLRDYPDIAVYVDALRDTLGGHGAALQRRFVVRLTGTLAQWQLILSPRQGNSRVRRIRLTGARADIRTIEILAPDGARTVMRIGPPPAS
ncbi:MAG: LolA family protein [Steroidobacteraceae bacterium]